MKAQIRKNQKDWHIYIFWIILGAFALLFIMDAFSGNEFDQLPLVLCLLPLAIPVSYTHLTLPTILLV